MRRPAIFLTLLLLALSGPVIRPAHAAKVAQPVAYEPDPTTPQEVFDQMEHSFRPDHARGQHLRYQFSLTDPQGGKWWIEVNDGACTMGKGLINHPDVTFACSGVDWVRLSNGKLSGWMAFLTGRLRVTGSQHAAHKLDEMFP